MFLKRTFCFVCYLASLLLCATLLGNSLHASDSESDYIDSDYESKENRPVNRVIAPKDLEAVNNLLKRRIKGKKSEALNELPVDARVGLAEAVIKLQIQGGQPADKYVALLPAIGKTTGQLGREAEKTAQAISPLKCSGALRGLIATTPEARQILGRKIVNMLHKAGVLTSRTKVRARRTLFLKREEEAEKHEAKLEARERADARERDLIYGFTRAAAKEVLAFIHADTLPGMIDSYKKWIQEKGKANVSRADIAAYFEGYMKQGLKCIYEDGVLFMIHEEAVKDFLAVHPTSLDDLKRGANLSDWEWHHLMQDEAVGDIILLMPSELHTPDIHPFGDQSRIKRQIFDGMRKSANKELAEAYS